MRLAALLAVLFAALLSGCNILALGPDLARAPSPFGEASAIHIDDGHDSLDIHHTPAGDEAKIMLRSLDYSQPFDAALTYQPVASDDDPQHDYWLIGVNVFRSPDRSGYVMVRYPHGLKIAAPMHSDAFETLSITCQMRTGQEDYASIVDPDSGMWPHPKPAEAEMMEDGTVPPPDVGQPPLDTATPPETPPKPCDFQSREELQAYLPTFMAAQLAEAANRAPDETGTYEWHPVTVSLP